MSYKGWWRHVETGYYDAVNRRCYTPLHKQSEGSSAMNIFAKPVTISYDESVDAAYIKFTSVDTVPAVVKTYPCDPVEVGGMINLDFNTQGHLVGVELLGARSKLPAELLNPADELR